MEHWPLGVRPSPLGSNLQVPQQIRPRGAAHCKRDTHLRGLHSNFGFMTHYFARFCAIWKIFKNIYASGFIGVDLSK